MSDLLNSASLVMIPSGYKEDVVYSEVPTNGNGDLSFTRASNGTRVNSSGLVEDCPWNLAQQSETFDNAIWTKVNTTITANNTTAPNGTTTADKFAPNGTLTATYFSLSQEVVSGATSQAHTAIIYAKAGALTQMLMYLGNQIGIYFNLSNGQFISYYNGVQTITNYSSEAVGDGWYKYTISISANSASTYLEVYGAKSGAFIGNYTTADDFFVWGAQLNIGSTAKPYFPTTDRLNVPRLTYQNGGGGCPSLLLEKQSTNINTYSEDFSNVDYTKINTTITSNQTTSPDGTTNADKFSDNSTNDYHIVYPSTLSITASRVTTSVYLKNNDIQFCAFQLATSIGGTYDTRFTLIADLVNGTITDTEQVGTPNAVYSIQNVGNGWYRLNITCDHVSGNVAFVVGGSNSGTPSSFTAALPVYVGTGKSLFVWGAQIEASSYPTSYIPTTSSSATRVADACFKTGISSLIGQSQGTIFAEIVRTQSTATDSFWINISDNSSNNWIFMGMEQTFGRFYVKASSTTIVDEYPAISLGRHKLAIGYQSGSIVGYVDGVQVFTSSATFTLNSLTGINIGYSGASITGAVNTSGQVNQAILFPTRLTNAELASLTTL